MKIWKLAALPIGLLGSQALAENWVNVDTDGLLQIDKDSIRRGSDGFLYFTDTELGENGTWAADCQRRVIYMNDQGDLNVWDAGNDIKPGSVSEMQLNYVCANAK